MMSRKLQEMARESTDRFIEDVENNGVIFEALKGVLLPRSDFDVMNANRVINGTTASGKKTTLRGKSVCYFIMKASIYTMGGNMVYNSLLEKVFT